jgi:hypothetical protein
LENITGLLWLGNFLTFINIYNFIICTQQYATRRVWPLYWNVLSLFFFSFQFFDRQRLFTTIFNPTRLANGEGSTLGTLIFEIEFVSARHQWSRILLWFWKPLVHFTQLNPMFFLFMIRNHVYDSENRSCIPSILFLLFSFLLLIKDIIGKASTKISNKPQ